MSNTRHGLPVSDYKPHFSCDVCLDTSWRPFRCDGGDRSHVPQRDADLPVYPCGRKAHHAPHGYVERCGCNETNPTLKAARERSQRREKVVA